MKIKLIDAVSLHNVVSQLNVSSLKEDKEKLALIKLSVRLKKYAQQWQDTIEAARTMAKESADALINKEAITEVELSDELLISEESLEIVVVANSATLPTGALAYIIEHLSKPTT